MDTYPTLAVARNRNGHQHALVAPTDTEGVVRQLLQTIGENPDRAGLEETPRRVARMYRELTAGYDMEPQQLINGALFDVQYNGMVVVKDIEFYSLCEHHLLPFFGQAHVAYLPGEKVIGLSKIPRIVEMYARRLQVQERLTEQIAAALESVLQPLGVGVVVEGQHMCSVMRGVKKTGSRMVTTTYLGDFQADPQIRAEFMEHIKRG